ncbi:MAG TPA: bifunctional 2-polyprenyl-6-hydroxyphenol methylase/3-demethylubiquinol 3-O-methyltransferase UbiG [Deltaproteobacteria bacterium]|nr:bifunctional 2-polyprenyl-6-hydroxyphenol methylase/3-demethylubiquinol 3-O-methyltransferase UbiG [Deltaproteobacteria bacterium]
MPLPNNKLNLNVDDTEIAKFSELAHSWWDKEGRFKSLHDINQLRVDYIADRVPLSGLTVLDVGCGGGLLSEALAIRGARVTGIDMGDAPLAAAKYHMQISGLNIEYRKATVEALAEREPEAFDVIICMELLEHVPDPSSVLKACTKLTKPGGDLFFATINRNIKSYLFAIIGAEHILRLLPRGTHAFKKFVKPSEMVAWAEDNDLSLQNITGLHYNPFTRKYSLGGNVHVNYMAYFKKKLKAES